MVKKKRKRGRPRGGKNSASIRKYWRECKKRQKRRKKKRER